MDGLTRTASHTSHSSNLHLGHCCRDRLRDQLHEGLLVESRRGNMLMVLGSSTGSIYPRSATMRERYIDRHMTMT